MNERNCFVKKGGQGRALVGGGFHNLKPVFLTVIISSLYKMCLSCTQNVSFLTYRFCPIMAISYCAKFCNGPYNHMFQSILEVLFEKSHFNPQFFTFFINLLSTGQRLKEKTGKLSIIMTKAKGQKNTMGQNFMNSHFLSFQYLVIFREIIFSRIHHKLKGFSENLLKPYM